MKNIRWIILFCICLCILALGVGFFTVKATTNSTETDFAAIDTYVERQMKIDGIPGLALAIVRGDEIVHLRGFGTASPSGQPVTAQTPFMIGSVTKPITAMAIMQLLDAGKIELDAPVQQYLPWFKTADNKLSARVTVLHLLNQTSGFGNLQGVSYLAGDGQDTVEQRVREALAQGFPEPLGVHVYSNLNYATLGLIVEAISGQPYEVYAQEHIYTLLDMKNTFNSKDEAMAHGMARGHNVVFGFPVPTNTLHFPNSLGEGSTISSAEDLAHFLIAHLNEGRYEDNILISPAVIELLHQPPAGEEYYLGLRVGEFNGLPILNHGGDQLDFHSDIIMNIDQKWGIVVLENTNAFLKAPLGANSRISRGVTSLLLGAEPAGGVGLRLASAISSVVIVIFTALLVRSLMRLGKWRRDLLKRPRGILSIIRHIILPIVGDLIFPVFMLFLTAGNPFPHKTDMWVVIGRMQPDLTYWLLTLALALLLKAIARIILVVIYPSRSQTSAESITIPPVS